MPLVLKLGSLDLSPYVGLQKDDGFDPADPDYAEPLFSSSPLREGGQLLGEAVGLREMVWPLKLVAASKDALHDLVGQINREPESQAETTRVEWQDKGATRSTFYDVVHVRFEPDFHYWRGQKNRLNGILRVQVQPYGHSATERLIATAGVANNHLLRVPIPSGAIAGDVPAEVDVRVVTDSDLVTQDVALAALPHASYAPQFPAASMVELMAGATVRTGQAGVPFGGFLAAPISWDPTAGAKVGAFYLPIPSAHLGPNRVVAFVHSVFNQGALVWATDLTGALVGPVASIGYNTGWQPLDLGVLNVDGSHWESVNLRAQTAASSGYLASPAFNVSDVILLPEEQTVLGAAPAWAGASLRWRFDGIDKRTWLQWPDGTFLRDLTGDQRGAIPKLAPGTRDVVTLAMNVGAARQADDTMSAEVRVRERFSFAR